MEEKLDPAQFGNQAGVSIQHYLIQMLHIILAMLDNNSKGDVFAVVANLIDWNNAFPRQCPKLGIESFIENGVRPSLIPVLINYFQEVHFLRRNAFLFYKIDFYISSCNIKVYTMIVYFFLWQ